MRSRLVWMLLAVAFLTACSSGTVKDEKEVARRSADTYIELGISYMQKGDLNTALQRLEQAVEVAPDYAPAHNAVALIYERIGEVKKTRKHLKKAVRLDPKLGSARNNYGRFLCGQKEFDAAQKQFSAAYENALYVRPWLAYTNAGLCAQEQGDEVLAEEMFRGALRRNPVFAPALTQMARLKFLEKNYMSTRAYLERLREVANLTPETLWLGVQTEQALANMDGVASYGLQLRANYPDSQELIDYEFLVRQMANSPP